MPDNRRPGWLFGDVNHDGTLTAAEFDGITPAKFTMRDRNHDQAITPDEIPEGTAGQRFPLLGGGRRARLFQSAATPDRRSAMSTRTGGRILIDNLVAQGCDRIFTVPGESFLAVLDALHDTPAIDLVVCRQEGGVAYMADADARLTGGRAWRS